MDSLPTVGNWAVTSICIAEDAQGAAGGACQLAVKSRSPWQQTVLGILYKGRLSHPALPDSEDESPSKTTAQGGYLSVGGPSCTWNEEAHSRNKLAEGDLGPLPSLDPHLEYFLGECMPLQGAEERRGPSKIYSLYLPLRTTASGSSGMYNSWT